MELSLDTLYRGLSVPVGISVWTRSSMLLAVLGGVLGRTGFKPKKCGDELWTSWMAWGILWHEGGS